MKIAILAVLLLGVQIGSTQDVKKPSCIKLYIALRHFLRLLSAGGEDSPAAMFSSATGIDPSDNMAIKKFACQIADVKSLEEAEALLPSDEMSVDVLEALYGKLLAYIEEQGGMDIMGKAYQIVTHIMEGGELLDLTTVNFQVVPVHVDPDVLAYMFEDLVKHFGKEFLEMFFSNTVTFDDIPTLVAAITESGSLQEAAKDLKIEPGQLERFLGNFGHIVSQEMLPLPFIKAAYFLLITASEYGLLSLPVH